MILRIITPDKEEINAQSVNFVHLRLADGNPISIYPGHIRLMGLIKEGSLKFSDDQKKHQVSVSDGLLLVDRDEISCHVNWARRKKNDLDDRK